jgi:hypothetical protein
MKTIEWPVIKTDFIDELIKRDGDVVLSVRRSRHSGRVVSYEVQVVRVHRRDMLMNGRLMSCAGDEYLPSSSEWGQYGWSFGRLQDAERKFQQVLERQSVRA